MKTNGMKYIILMAAMISIAVPAFAVDEDAQSIQEDVQKTINGMLTFSCSFSTEQYNKVLDRNQKIEGTIDLDVRKTFMLRYTRRGSLTVIDGKTVKTYLPRHKQIQLSDFAPEGEDYPSPHTIFRRYSERRNARIVGEEEVDGRVCDVLELVSSDGDGAKVTVWIDRELKFPVKARELLANGDSILHTLTDVRLNEEIDQKLFELGTPEGVSIVDLRE